VRRRRIDRRAVRDVRRAAGTDRRGVAAPDVVGDRFLVRNRRGGILRSARRAGDRIGRAAVGRRTLPRHVDFVADAGGGNGSRRIVRRRGALEREGLRRGIVRERLRHAGAVVIEGLDAEVIRNVGRQTVCITDGYQSLWLQSRETAVGTGVIEDVVRRDAASQGRLPGELREAAIADADLGDGRRARLLRRLDALAALAEVA